MFSNRNLLFKAVILALCIISCVHLFLFPLFETSTNVSHIRTYWDLEKSLCQIRYRKSKNSKPGKCPENGIVTVSRGGRLGNQIWEYASVYALARETGLEPYIPRCIKTYLESMFDKLSLPTLDEIGHCLVKTNFFMHSLEDVTINYLESLNLTNQSIILPKFIIQAELVSTWVQDIVQEFNIKKSLLEKSQKILRSAVKHLNVPVKTFIGVHVRRTDYVRYIKKKFDAQPVDLNFFLSAMDYFERKYPDPIFIFVSDDPSWCWKNFSFKKNVYVTGKYHNSSPALDMTTLASCNHTIYDYGTYGEWGAILAGGETIYYNLSKRHSSHKFGKYMKNWHTL